MLSGQVRRPQNKANQLPTSTETLYRASQGASPSSYLTAMSCTDTSTHCVGYTDNFYSPMFMYTTRVKFVELLHTADPYFGGHSTPGLAAIKPRVIKPQTTPQCVNWLAWRRGSYQYSNRVLWMVASMITNQAVPANARSTEATTCGVTTWRA